MGRHSDYTDGASFARTGTISSPAALCSSLIRNRRSGILPLPKPSKVNNIFHPQRLFPCRPSHTTESLFSGDIPVYDAIAVTDYWWPLASGPLDVQLDTSYPCPRDPFQYESPVTQHTVLWRRNRACQALHWRSQVLASSDQFSATRTWCQACVLGGRSIQFRLLCQSFQAFHCCLSIGHPWIQEDWSHSLETVQKNGDDGDTPHSGSWRSGM